MNDCTFAASNFRSSYCWVSVHVYAPSCSLSVFLLGLSHTTHPTRIYKSFQIKTNQPTNLNMRKSQRKGFLVQKNWFLASRTKKSQQIWFSTVEFKPSSHEHFQPRIKRHKYTRREERSGWIRRRGLLSSKDEIRSIFGNVWGTNCPWGTFCSVLCVKRCFGNGICTNTFPKTTPI